MSTGSPVDLAAVQADDALLDTGFGPWLAKANADFNTSVTAEVDVDLARCLVAWRRAVDSEKIPELISAGDSLAVIAAARRPAGYDPPLRVSPFFTGVVAALALTFGVGFGLLILALVTR